MIRIRHVIVGLILLVAASACTERMICPAYQSAFIHDKSALNRHFSYFGEDSMPKILEASKDRHLLIDPVTFRKKNRSLRTVVMKDIYPQPPDSLLFNDEFSEAERDVTTTDSSTVASDSVYVISIKKEKFNTDQELYLWYMRKYLVYPDVKLMQEQNAEANGEADTKTEKKSFFKRLFGKKNKADSTNFDIETSATELNGSEKKKGLGLFKKKDKKAKEPKAPKAPKEAKPKPDDATPVEEDDGEEDF